MKKIIILGLLILLALTAMDDTPINTVIIPEDAIRLRILANSNTEEDQSIKKDVSDKVQKEISKNLSTVTNPIDAEEKIIESIPKIKNVVNESLLDNNVNYTYKVDYGYHYFPEKEYKGVIYEEGEYKSLLVTLGEGEGNNWWCVLFPPLCLIEAEESVEEVEYQFFIKKLIEKYF